MASLVCCKNKVAYAGQKLERSCSECTAEDPRGRRVLMIEGCERCGFEENSAPLSEHFKRLIIVSVPIAPSNRFREEDARTGIGPL
jgi:hypothetical protein